MSAKPCFRIVIALAALAALLVSFLALFSNSAPAAVQAAPVVVTTSTPAPVAVVSATPSPVAVESNVFVAPLSFVGNIIIEGSDLRANACRTYHVFGHQAEQVGETDAVACDVVVVEPTKTREPKPTMTTTVGTPVVTVTTTPSPTATSTSGTPDITTTKTPAPTNTPAPSKTPVVTDPPVTNTPAPTNTPEPTKEARNCGIGNGVDGDTKGCPNGRNDGEGHTPATGPGSAGGNGNNVNTPANENSNANKSSVAGVAVLALYAVMGKGYQKRIAYGPKAMDFFWTDECVTLSKAIAFDEICALRDAGYEEEGIYTKALLMSGKIIKEVVL